MTQLFHSKKVGLAPLSTRIPLGCAIPSIFTPGEAMEGELLQDTQFGFEDDGGPPDPPEPVKYRARFSADLHSRMPLVLTVGSHACSLHCSLEALAGV